jgi:hypothetical protein
LFLQLLLQLLLLLPVLPYPTQRLVILSAAKNPRILLLLLQLLSPFPFPTPSHDPHPALWNQNFKIEVRT